MNAEYYENSIRQLDAALVQGYNMLFTVRNELFGPNADEQSKTSTYKKYWEQYVLWQSGVYDIIRLTTDRQYYSVHFMSLKRTAMTLNGLNDQQSSFIIGFESKVKTLVDILTMLEERRNVVIRQEIARQERDASVLYEITYTGREIRINDIYLSKPDFMSENELFFSYVFERPWQKIKIEDMLADLKIPKFKKSVSQMLSDLRFTGNIRKVFCPDASSKGIMFRNPVTRGFADDHNLSAIELGRNDKK